MMRDPIGMPGPSRPIRTAPGQTSPMIRITLSDHQFADVAADRVTFDGADIVLWHRGAEVARHHAGSVTALLLSSDGAPEHPRRARRSRPRPRPRPSPLLLPRPWGAA